MDIKEKIDINEKENMNNKREETKELGIYVHIPFCVQKCNYCDFLSAPAPEEVISQYVRALLRQIQSFRQLRQLHQYGQSPQPQCNPEYGVSTIFFGGGTPSLLAAEQIASVIGRITECFPCREGMEVTLEANPGTLTGEKLKGFYQAGVNRLSMGLQCTDNAMLRKLGRIHTYGEFLDNYQMAREAGFSNINVDLMTGLPGQTQRQWEECLLTVVGLNPEHVSAYSLILEPETAFYQKYNDHREELPDEDAGCRMYERTGEILAEYGYHRYEISNYCKAGYECRHNEVYWKRGDYAGFGIGAASLLSGVRCTQKRELSFFLDNPDWNDNTAGRDILSVAAQMEETMFLGLRRMEGVSRQHFLEQFGKSMDEIYGDVIGKYKKLGMLKEQDGKIALTKQGILVSNIIFSDFLISES